MKGSWVEYNYKCNDILPKEIYQLKDDVIMLDAAIELIISIWLEQQYKSGDGKPRITTLCQNVNVQEKYSREDES